ncbi:Wzy polymerase domain-containing protein [Variovorax sp. J22R133]|uniref:PglL family O-oligosaccharyltransferase n=1 Tax=Variovorax brevis TaxID=3053503 RepID=UPI0025790656|nr:Wzy polymerase domain-containing protein [Variovorax sp. J22R133]MDM0115283.1 Wzy polymerase domain-containing protein [Variovorax sp. J22R133]
MVALSGSGDLGQRLAAPAAICVVGLAASVGAGMARADPLPLAWGLFAAALVSAAIGLLQYSRLGGSLAPWMAASDHGQAFGNLRQRNQFATLISMGLIAALWLHAKSDGARLRLALKAAGVLLVLALAASGSRTGFFQLLLIVVAVGVLLRRRTATTVDHHSKGFRWPLALPALMAAYGLALWALPRATSGSPLRMLHRLRDIASDSRTALWSNVLDQIEQHPWRGWGWGELSFAHFDTLYADARFPGVLDNAHNLPLHLAVELGVPAALLLCGFFGWLVWRGKPWAERDLNRLAVWGLLGAILVHSMVEYPLWFGPFQMVFGLCLGFLWPREASAGHAGAQAPAPRRAASAAVAALMLCALGFTAWDYTRVSQIYLDPARRLPGFQQDTLAQAEESALFANHARFAQLTLTPLTNANAREIHALALHLLHFSPEPRVISKVIESAETLGLDDEAAAHTLRFQRAFPAEFKRWSARKPPAPAKLPVATERAD